MSFRLLLLVNPPTLFLDIGEGRCPTKQRSNGYNAIFVALRYSRGAGPTMNSFGAGVMVSPLDGVDTGPNWRNVGIDILSRYNNPTPKTVCSCRPLSLVIVTLYMEWFYSPNAAHSCNASKPSQILSYTQPTPNEPLTIPS